MSSEDLDFGPADRLKGFEAPTGESQKLVFLSLPIYSLPPSLSHTSYILHLPTLHTYIHTNIVWEEFTPLAKELKAINLGQGFPDWPTPTFCKEAAKKAIDDDYNQVGR